MENNRIVPAVPHEKAAPRKNGFFMLLVNLIGMIAAIFCLIFGCIRLENGFYLYGGILLTAGILGITAFSILLAGFKVLAPNQAYVFTLFGKYYGTIKAPGFYHVNPFVTANAPAVITMVNGQPAKPSASAQSGTQLPISTSKKISLKTRTLDNRTQKVNDAMGNPIIIGSVVIWRVADPTAAVFAVENFEEYLSIQCDSTIRNIARLYPYDTLEDDADEKTLRGSSSEVSEIMQQELAARVKDAGIVIEDVRITTLAYSDEIASAMLQRQQATA
ncbi:MAG: SPFH domain-containing protein, partial [Clostridia bacterium]|nr:SPFH domain-containing protein [Clostridia bacterium]